MNYVCVCVCVCVCCVYYLYIYIYYYCNYEGCHKIVILNIFRSALAHVEQQGPLLISKTFYVLRHSAVFTPPHFLALWQIRARLPGHFYSGLRARGTKVCKTFFIVFIFYHGILDYISTF